MKKPIKLSRTIARSLLVCFGWSLMNIDLPTSRGVIVAYPHTSNWDFCVGMLAKWGLGINVRFLAKNSLFNIPLLGAWFRYLGGISIDRSSPNGYVGQLASDLDQQNSWIVFAPEGTRKLTPGWRSGFYRLALSSNVPIVLAILDFKNKRVGLAGYLMPTGDEFVDLEIIRNIYKGCGGCRPENASPIIFWSPRQHQ